ncbi:urea carboxylase-associated family protein [Acidothermaceae bacterium B102]|nr:urea carboxylase-associated family protein [Acidothermaceae bacterium B102]
MSDDVQRLPARTGAAVRLAPGDVLTVVNPAGSQVVDTWALLTGDPTEHLSMEHTRAALLRLVPRVGDALVSNRRRPVLTLVEDTSPGVHDTLIPACDPERYRMLGASPGHASCHDNFRSAVRAAGVEPPPVPAPLNLFMNVPWTPDGALAFAPPVSRPGDRVGLRAEVDLLVVMSACPQDLVPVNGAAQEPSDILFGVTTFSLG